MKKIIMTAAAVFALAFVNAQDSKEGMRFGFKAGLTMSNFAGGDNEIDPSMKAGSHIGGYGEFKVSEKFAIQPELMYSTQGAKYELPTPEGATEWDYTVRLGYLNLPVMAKYFVNEKFSLEAGPQIGFLLSAKGEEAISYTEEGRKMVDSYKEDTKDDFNSTDIGFNLGAGYEFTKNISAGLRYMVGLSDLEKNVPAEVSANKNSVFQLSVGYMF